MKSSEVFVDVINPSLEIVKSVDKTVVHAGDEVTYSFRVKNTGDTTLYDILVTDSVLGTIGTIESLSPGEEVTLEKKVNIYSDTRNVARATGYDELQMEAEDESSEVFVDVINPSLEIVKSVDKTVVHAGDEVTYSFRVKNTGDTTLYDILVTDSVLGTIGTIESLSPGEEVTLEKKVNIYSDTRNVARATGYDELQMEAEDESSEVFVDVINPSLEIVKSVDKTVVHAGDEVTYSFRVKNTGDTTLYDILVTDSVLGTIGTIESLSPGEEVTLEKKVNIYSDTRNVARATGYDELQMEAEDESSEVFVDVIGLSYISGFVFLDANLNGIFDPGETPIPGITVFLFKEGVQIATTTTASDGSYKFDDLEPGTYLVTIDLPLEYDLTTPASITLSIDEENSGRADFGLTPAPVLPFTPELPPVLPYTGPDTLWFLKLALSLMLSLSGILILILSMKVKRKI